MLLVSNNQHSFMHWGVTAAFNAYAQLRTCPFCRYEIQIVPDSLGGGAMWEVATPVEGQPSAADLLMLTAMQCMSPVDRGTAKRPKQLLLAYRCAHFSSSLANSCAAHLHRLPRSKCF
jgi:hypothetical protein